VALEKIGGIFDRWIDPLVRVMGNVPPALVSWSTLPVAGTACAFAAIAGRDTQGAVFLFLAVFLVGIAGLLDVLDGKLARRQGTVSRYGDFLDHTLDRVVDLGLVLAMGHNSEWVPDGRLGWVVAVAVLLGSYMGTQAQAVGLRRIYGGFSRADRTAVLCLGLSLGAVQVLAGWNDMRLLDMPLNGPTVALVLTGVGGLWTFIRRFVDASGQLRGAD